MTKTKRQLRAEAVERLRGLGGDIPSARILKAVYPQYNPFVDGDKHMLRDFLVSLLTDDEPPEGDAVSEFAEILMELAANCSCMGDGIVRHFEPKDVRAEVDALMRVVERDYVSRKQWAEAVRAMKAAQDRMEQARAERDTLQGALDIAVQNESKLEAERDEWKAKAEGLSKVRAGQNNLDWLYEHDEFFNRFARWYVTDGATADDDIEAGEWLMSEHVDGTSSEIPEKPAGEGKAWYGMTAQQTADAFADFKAKLPRWGRDTREKLEADVREYIDGWAEWGDSMRVYGSCMVAAVNQWLDRQAAITERELTANGVCDPGMQQRVAEQDRRIAELQAKLDEAEHTISGMDDLHAEREAELQSEVAELQATVRQLSGDLEGARKSRDHWRRVAGRNGEEIGKLKAGLNRTQRQLPKGWPCFEDGHPVMPGDEFYIYYQKRMVTRISVDMNAHFTVADNHGGLFDDLPHGDCPRTFKRPPIIAKDGQPIEVGQTLYGQSDGKAWTVEGFDRKRKWSVWARDADDPERHKCLNPEWLAHEPPADELFECGCEVEA